MKFDTSKSLGIILNALFRPYMERVPDVKKITQAMVNEGILERQEDIVNDHVAFRSLGVPHLGMASLEKIFLYYGYEKKDSFYFTHKKLDAYWYAPPLPEFPRIFLSELRVGELSATAQDIIAKYTSGIAHDPVNSLDLADAEAVGRFFHRPLWDLPTLSEYQTLLAESEYAAWVIYNRYYLNHYTISVHELKEGYATLVEFNRFLEKIGIVLNDAGGVIKTSPDGLLLQSSSVAEMVEATFADGRSSPIAGSYVEFAERRVLPKFEHLPGREVRREHRREGFETGNADKIFESTFSTQTKKVNKGE